MVQTFRKIGDRVSHHGHRSDAEREFARIDFVKCVGLGVVTIEVVFAVDIENLALFKK